MRSENAAVEYRPEVDGLRAVAVIAVVLNHTSSALLPSGFLGVDVFFVISGYVITASIQGRESSSALTFLLAFYARRIKRLLPALVACVAITSLLISLFNPAPATALKTGLSALGAVSNFYLIDQAADYFADATQLNPFIHTWSLGVEEQFYLVFPALFLIFGKGVYRVLAALSVLSYAAFLLLAGTSPHLSYYLMPTRFWELAAGAFAFWLTRRPFAAPEWLSGGALAGLVVVLLLPADYQVPSTFAVVLLTALLIRTAGPGSRAHIALATPAVVAIGLVSYSLYLWHWPVLVIARWTVGIDRWTVVPLLALMGMLAVASYRLVEVPARQAVWCRSRMGEIALGLGTSIAVGGVVLLLATTFQGRLYAGTRPTMTATGVETLTAAYRTWRGLPCLVTSNTEVGKRIDPENCTIGSGNTRVLVLGNSVAAAFTHAFDELVGRGYAVTLAAAWGASPVRELRNSTRYSNANDHYWRSVVPELTSQLKAGDWVFLINDLAAFAPAHGSDKLQASLATLETGLRNLSVQLAGRGIRLGVMHAYPMVREANCEPAIAAEQWFSPRGGPCRFFTKQETLSRRAALDGVLRALEREGHLHVVDLMEVFCSKEVCNYTAADGSMLYRDSFSHPSVEAARLSAPLIARELSSKAAWTAPARH